MRVTNYYATKSDWTWTGRHTRNQLWSHIKVTEPILVDEIQVHWGGYDRSTKGRHFIAKRTGQGKLGAIVTKSVLINVSQGRKWRTAKCTPTLLEPGDYFVGVWGDPLGRRIVTNWISRDGLHTWTHQNTSLRGNVQGSQWRSKGVIPVRLNGDPAGRISVRTGGRWRTGNAWVRTGGRWRKAKAVWVRSGGKWRRGK